MRNALAVKRASLDCSVNRLTESGPVRNCQESKDQEAKCG